VQGKGGWLEFVGGGDGGEVRWWGMKQRVTERLSGVLMVVMGVSGCRQVMPDDAETSPVGPSVLSDREVAAALSGRVDFGRHVKPVLEVNCLPCHDGKEMPRFLDLRTRATAMTAGPYGPRIIPGNPGGSLIIRNLSVMHAPVKAMPPVGNRLTGEEKRILERWIAQGAEWPEGEAGRLRKPRS
jgi:hypothetical protein